jgi:hypothetical protein
MSGLLAGAVSCALSVVSCIALVIIWNVFFNLGAAVIVLLCSLAAIVLSSIGLRRRDGSVGATVLSLVGLVGGIIALVCSGTIIGFIVFYIVMIINPVL